MWNNKCQGRQGWGKLNDLHIFAIAEVGTKSQMVPDVYYIGGFYINSLLTSCEFFIKIYWQEEINIFMYVVFKKEIQVIFARRKSSDKFETFITSIFDISNMNSDSSIRRKYSDIRVNHDITHKSMLFFYFFYVFHYNI